MLLNRLLILALTLLVAGTCAISTQAAPAPAPVTIVAVKVAYDRPDPVFKGQRVDIVKIKMHNYTKAQLVRFTLHSFGATTIGEDGIVMYVVKSAGDVKFIGQKTNATYQTSLAPDHVKYVTFYLRDSPGEIYCASGTRIPPMLCGN